jgi:hypothetical protein
MRIDDAPVDPVDHPIARARRGEVFDVTVVIARGRRRIGRFAIRSTAIGPGSGGPMLDEATQA